MRRGVSREWPRRRRQLLLLRPHIGRGETIAEVDLTGKSLKLTLVPIQLPLYLKLIYVVLYFLYKFIEEEYF
jgi:hypothetical protein